MDPLDVYGWQLGDVPPPETPDEPSFEVPGSFHEWSDFAQSRPWKYLQTVIQNAASDYRSTCETHYGVGVLRAQGALVVLKYLDSLVPTVLEQKRKVATEEEEYQNV